MRDQTTCCTNKVTTYSKQRDPGPPAKKNFEDVKMSPVLKLLWTNSWAQHVVLKECEAAKLVERTKEQAQTLLQEGCGHIRALTLLEKNLDI